MRYSYVYNANGALHTVTDHKNDTQTLYRYDGAGKLIASYELNSNEIVYSDSFVYTDDEKLLQYNSWLSYKTNTGYYREYAVDAYGYNSNRQISTYRIVSDNLDSDIAFTYDNMLRVSGETLTWGDQNGAIYQQQTVYDYYGKTPQLNGITVNLYGGEGETQISSKTYRYSYDQNGNITEIKDAANVVQNKYYYDDLGQLIREDNRALNKTYTYEYDDAGNMLYKRQCAFTTSATLPAMSTIFDMTHETYNGWGDQMDMDNINYYDFTYDKVGNLLQLYYPEEYFDFTWEGRQLTSAHHYYRSYYGYIEEEYYNVQYTYNESGIRTSKTVDGVKHEYLLNGSQIIAETWTKNGIEYMLRYIYDESGAPIGMKYRTSQQIAEYYSLYFFEKNAFGDIIGIYDSGWECVGTYKYDAWGNCVVSGTDSILTMNPFRYRGYYYDTETGFYYLQSRYYNPAWGRFLNADSYITTGQGLLSYNMYAYCNNNPVMGYDPSGKCFHRWDFWNHCDSCGGGNLGQDILSTLDSAMESYRSFVHYCFMELPTVVWNSIEIDTGIGQGIGIDVEVDDISISALVRADYISFRKSSGDNSRIHFGQFTSTKLSLEVGGYVVPLGVETEYDFQGHVTWSEELDIHYDYGTEIGTSGYVLIIGGTFKIGFNVDYFLQKTFGIGGA